MTYLPFIIGFVVIMAICVVLGVLASGDAEGRGGRIQLWCLIVFIVSAIGFLITCIKWLRSIIPFL